MKLTLFSVIFVGLSVIVIDSRIISRPDDGGGCTIGVFSGRVTVDGRPLLWKNRDITNAVQKFCYYARTINADDTTFAYTGNAYSNDTTRVYMGLNEVGFAIMNANTYNLNDNLSDGVDDGSIMKMALERCRNLGDFEHILDATSITGRRDCWNFGAIDGFGNGAIYECSNRAYTKFDINDSLMEGDGVLLRATFSFSGGDSLDGFSRFKRATHLVANRLRSGQIDAGFILQTLARDLANPLADPYPLPYNGSQDGRPAGFILAHDVTINRDISRSLVVIRGIAPGEDPRLATIYGMIGPAVLSVAYPLWVQARSVPAVLNFGINVPMYSQIVRRLSRLYPLPGDNPYLDSRYLIGKDSVGLFTYTLPLETDILNIVESYLDSWRREYPGAAVVAAVQEALADSIYNTYIRIPLDFPNQPPEEITSDVSIANYPNPFNTSTTIDLSKFGAGEPVELMIYDLLGREVRRFQAAGGNTVTWDGRNGSEQSLSSGVYLIQARGANHSATIKSMLMK